MIKAANYRFSAVPKIIFFSIFSKKGILLFFPFLLKLKFLNIFEIKGKIVEVVLRY